MDRKSRAQALAEWERIKPFFEAFWILLWGIFAAVCGILFLIHRPFEWGSWGFTWIGAGLIYLGLSCRRSAVKDLRQHKAKMEMVRSIRP